MKNIEDINKAEQIEDLKKATKQKLDTELAPSQLKRGRTIESRPKDSPPKPKKKITKAQERKKRT